MRFVWVCALHTCCCSVPLNLRVYVNNHLIARIKKQGRQHQDDNAKTRENTKIWQLKSSDMFLR